AVATEGNGQSWMSPCPSPFPLSVPLLLLEPRRIVPLRFLQPSFPLLDVPARSPDAAFRPFFWNACGTDAEGQRAASQFRNDRTALQHRNKDSDRRLTCCPTLPT